MIPQHQAHTKLSHSMERPPVKLESSIRVPQSWEKMQRALKIKDKEGCPWGREQHMQREGTECPSSHEKIIFLEIPLIH